MTTMNQQVLAEMDSIEYFIEMKEYEEYLQKEFEGWLESKQTPPDNM